MIKTEDIYAKTNNGLDIILSYYPQARESVETRKPFCLRNERTPSAYIKQFGNVWKVTDFGDDAHARSAIDIVMLEDNLTFKEALFKLAGQYEIGNTLRSGINKPDIRKRKPTKDEPDGHFGFECADKLTDAELKVFGPGVKQEHLDALGYKSVKWYSRTKKNETGNLETTVTSSNENYPIFVRVCLTDTGTEFYKFYQPLNYDKAFRFFYHGTKPKDYVNGLRELKRDFTRINEQERANFEADLTKSGKKYEDEKLKVVICSGERDAVNVQSFGYHPVWLNSESARLDPFSYKEICKYAEKVYNIPDIDETGKKKGIELGLQYLDIHTVKLPDWLTTYRDLRGKPRKDLRDFVELREKRADFENLLNTARPYKFWVEEDGKDGKKRLEINTEYMLNFLADAGFGKLQDKDTLKETFVKVDGNVVKEITSKNIREFLIQFVRKNISDVKVWNLVLNSGRTKTVAMDDLPVIDIDFTDNTFDTQFLFFNNKTIEVSGKGITEHRPADCNRYVWESAVSKHRFKRLAPAFEIKRNENFDTWDLDIKNTQSHYFRYLINGSRTCWQQELEERATGDAEADKAYFTENHFNIAGSRLTYEEVEEQMQNLTAKIFAIGYMMHRYKDMSKSWAVWAMEDKISEDGVSSGGSGKSFMIKFLSNFKKTVTLGGRNRKLTENKHIFENVNEQTGLLLVDDANKYVDFGFFYDTITGEMTIDEKGVSAKIIPFEKSPKLAFTSNFPPPNADSATLRRILHVVFSDWYHHATPDNGYRETRTIKDDFGYEICRGTYKAEFWNEDINFLIDCMQFYLSTVHSNTKIEPPIKKVQERTNIQIMGNQFKDWAEVYFSEISDNLDCEIVRTEAMEAFMKDSGVKSWTTNKFSKALRSFCENCKYVEMLNPPELHNASGRIIRKIDNKAVEMIYLKTYGKELEKQPF